MEEGDLRVLYAVARRVEISKACLLDIESDEYEY
jgi:cytoskeletal protein RodZ